MFSIISILISLDPNNNPLTFIPDIICAHIYSS